MAKRKRIAALILMLIVLGGFIYYRHQESTAQEAAHELKLSGNVDVREVSIAFRGSDRINEILVNEGDRVSKGQVLARLDSQEAELLIAKVKAEIRVQENAVRLLREGNRAEVINQAENKLRAAEASAANAQGVRERKQQIFDSAGAISRQELDNAVYAAQAAKAEAEAARQAYAEAVAGARAEEIEQEEAKLEALQQELARQEYLLSQMELTSPADGVIRSRLLEAGDMASPSIPVFKLSLDDKKWVRVYVKETDLAHVYEGQPAEVKIDSLSDKKLKGQVGYISGTAEFTPKTVQTDELRTSLVYEVRVYVDDTENVLRLGMPATAFLHI